MNKVRLVFYILCLGWAYSFESRSTLVLLLLIFGSNEYLIYLTQKNSVLIWEACSKTPSELIIITNLRKLSEHPCYKNYLENLGIDQEIKISHTLARLRFVIQNNVVWSDSVKSFFGEIGFYEKVFEISPEQEADLDKRYLILSMHVKNGMMKFYLFEETNLLKHQERHETLLCEFPLWIFTEVPRASLNFTGKNFLAVLKKRQTFEFLSVEKQAEMIKAELENLGFKSANENLTDYYRDFDGDFQVYDFDDSFWRYTNDFFEIKFRPFLHS